MTTRRDETPAYARSDGPSYQELLDRERHSVPSALRERHFEALGPDDVPVARYVSRAWHEREMERLWTRVWQMACREDEIPRAGDHVLYEIGPHSLIVVRQATGEIRAFHNACLHRGRALRTEGGHAERFRCPFHGFTWRLDGSLESVPCRWDFPHVRDDGFRLPEARVAAWGGFVFVNLDADPVPLPEWLGPIPAHFAPWDLRERVRSAYVAKVVAANWKVCVEAFLESLHVRATHPQILPSTADTNSQYDVSGDWPYGSRMITALGSPSPSLGPDFPEQAVVRNLLSGYADATGAAGGPALPSGSTARRFLADATRGLLAAGGVDVGDACDGEILDAIQYFVFPNFFPWGGRFQNIVYRFRPWADDPGQCLMEVMLLRPAPRDGSHPPPAPRRLLGPEEPWTAAGELGVLGAIFEQDMGNLPHVQRGLRASKKPFVTLSNYQESRIRHLHRTLGRFVGAD